MINNKLITILREGRIKMTFKEYLKYIHRALSTRTESMAVNRVVFNTYLRVNCYVSDRIFESFNGGREEVLSKEDFINGLTGLYFGDTETVIKHVFRILSSNKETLTTEEFITFANFLDLECNTEELIQLSKADTVINYERFSKISESKMFCLVYSYLLKIMPFDLGIISMYVDIPQIIDHGLTGPSNAQDDFTIKLNRIEDNRESRVPISYHQCLKIVGGNFKSYIVLHLQKELLFFTKENEKAVNLCDIYPLNGSAVLKMDKILKNKEVYYPLALTIKNSNNKANLLNILIFTNQKERIYFCDELDPSSHLKLTLKNYEIMKEISPNIKFCYNTTTKEKNLIKIIKKSETTKIAMDSLHNEINVLNFLKTHKHKNIIEIQDILEDKTNIYIIYENSQGGNLKNFINNKVFDLDEEEIKKILIELLNVLAFLKSKSIAIGRLDIENVFVNKSSLSEGIKLGDFDQYKFGPCEDIVYIFGIFLLDIAKGKYNTTTINDHENYERIKEDIVHNHSNLLVDLIEMCIYRKINFEELSNHAFFKENILYY